MGGIQPLSAGRPAIAMARLCLPRRSGQLSNATAFPFAYVCSYASPVLGCSLRCLTPLRATMSYRFSRLSSSCRNGSWRHQEAHAHAVAAAGATLQQPLCCRTQQPRTSGNARLVTQTTSERACRARRAIRPQCRANCLATVQAVHRLPQGPAAGPMEWLCLLQ